ncbi:hypothetical protein CPC08DRAFT_549447 [Agrocybe pediades]|nr:hypothetical protein CPC08DRAFT_549447 [Agrocybe pediades]
MGSRPYLIGNSISIYVPDFDWSKVQQHHGPSPIQATLFMMSAIYAKRDRVLTKVPCRVLYVIRYSVTNWAFANFPISMRFFYKET